MRSLKKCGCLLSVFSVAIYIAVYLHFSSCRFKHSLFVETGKHTNPVKIVFWTGSLRHAGIKGPKAVRLERLQRIVRKMNIEKNEICRIIRRDGRKTKSAEDDDEQGHCEFSTSSPSDTSSDGDAIAFYMFTVGYKLSELPNLDNRKAEQIWVMYSLEPPPLLHWRNPLHNLFNWTMSYRRDSDIWTPYGKYIEKVDDVQTEDFLYPGDVNMAQWITGKNKLIAGVISNCHTDSLREKLISEMNSTGVRVNVYGDCGQPTGGKHSNGSRNFWKDLARQYKFYMAFENSLCDDYITEKFWRALDLGMVPVVYGGGNYELEAPPNSYIKIRDFSSAEDLMKYVKYLDENPTEYAKYFEWKRKFKLQRDWDSTFEDWCSLCRAVKKRFRKTDPQFRKTYKNLNFWWHHKSHSNEPVCNSKPKKHFYSEKL